MTTVSVPGKVHLMGEHAVVYGKPALLAAINKRLWVTVDASSEKQGIEAPEGQESIMHALSVVCDHLGIPRTPPVWVSVRSDIPVGYHLGSSAAIAVAAVAASLFELKKIWNPQLVNQLAFEVEKKHHGNPSGGDNTIVTMGGFVWYRKELDFLKSIWQLPVRLPPLLDHFCLVDTGRPQESTKDMVALVAKRYADNTQQMDATFLQNEEQTRRVAVALKHEHEQELIDAMRSGQTTLEHMGVVSPKVTPVIRAIEESGGAAKILGGGGKTEGVGFLLCYHEKKDQLIAAVKPFGHSVSSVVLGEEGIRLER